jgi:hypothetical protein
MYQQVLDRVKIDIHLPQTHASLYCLHIHHQQEKKTIKYVRVCDQDALWA